MEFSCFKAYDIRGRLPDELNEKIAYLVGRGYADHIKPSRVVVGQDIRASSHTLKQALCRGLQDAGVDVYDLGLVGSEEVYFATFHENFDGGLMVTGSHNPMDYNGIKLVREDAKPLSADSGLGQIKAFVEKFYENENQLVDAPLKGKLHVHQGRAAYLEHLLTYLDLETAKELKIVVNAGNGPAGLVIDALEQYLPFEFVKINHNPDPDFPNGIPNPLLPENREVTANAVREHKADFGVAWDGDFDRCFLFDETGRYISCYYVVGMLAEALLARQPGQKIVYDPRLNWNTIDIVRQIGGHVVASRAGHSFMKQKMREVDAVFCGEVSGHYFFRDFGYCDSGMIPWLMVADMMCRRDEPLSKLVGIRHELYPSGDELNLELGDVTGGIIHRVEEQFMGQALKIDRLDGLSMEFTEWRFNIRPSNTEPLIRLNVEAKGDENLVRQKQAEIKSFIEQITT